MPKHKKGTVPIMAAVRSFIQSRTGDLIGALVIGMAGMMIGWWLIWTIWIYM